VIQGSGNMPAYGKNLKPSEVAAVVAFMRTLHSPSESPARDSAQPAQPAAEKTQAKALAQAERTPQ